MTLMMIILAICGGATLSIQAAINGQLGSNVGVFKSAFLTFSVGALVTDLLIFFVEPKQAITLLPSCPLIAAWMLSVAPPQTARRIIISVIRYPCATRTSAAMMKPSAIMRFAFILLCGVPSRP